MQTVAVRGSDCRHVLFTAPAGCLQGKLNPFPLHSSTVPGVCLQRKTDNFSTEAALHNKMTSKQHEMLLLGVLASPTSSSICTIKDVILYCAPFNLGPPSWFSHDIFTLYVQVPFIAHECSTPQ